MRLVLVLLAAALLLLPGLILLFRPGVAAGRRVAQALLVGLSPFVLLGLIHGVPELDGRALDHPVVWTTLRLLLTGLAVLAPWCLLVLLRAR